MDKIFKFFCAKSDIKPVLQQIHFFGEHAVATDSYKLIECQVTDEDKDELRALATLKKIKLATAAETEEFPEYKQIMPKESELADEEQYITFNVNAKYLKEVAEAMERCAGKKNETITMHVSVRHSRPLVFKTPRATALLMKSN